MRPFLRGSPGKPMFNKAEYQRAYQQRNKEAILAKRKEWYIKNIERERNRAKEWGAAHREQKLKAQREYISANGDKRREYMRKRYAEKRDELIAKNRLRRADKPEVERDWYLRTEYGISLQQFVAMLELQGGCCAICGHVQKRLSVDHDHNTGRVRGLLCGSCNNGLGRFKDNATALRKAAEYLDRSAP
jgi:hypothetical protein